MRCLKSNLFRVLMLAMALILNIEVYAQTTVNGLVIDSNREPVIGASVLVKGTTTGAATDFDGRFTLKVPDENSILVISYVGCETREVAANSAELQSGVIMRENVQNLDELVVIGYGSVKKSDATGSVIAIKPDEFNKGNRVTAQDALVGKVAGVNVVNGSGAPGSGATIRVRSGASLSASNDPLIVIDGVPVDNSTIEGSSNIIGSLNPDDIETFTVLKDASATAIYGSRASNGVIVITTKKGNDRLAVNYSSSYSVSTTADRLDVLTAEEFKAFVPTVTGVPANPSFGSANTDWQDEIYRTAFGTEQNISVSGKVKPIKAPFRVSLGYTNQNGIIENNKMVDNSVVGAALRYDPTRPVMTGSPTAATDPGLGYFIWTNGGSPMAIQTNNPVAQLELTDQRNKVVRSIGSAALQYKVHGLEDLKLNVNLGYDVLESKYNKDVPDLAGTMYTENQKDGTGLMQRGVQNKQNLLLDAFANYDKTFADKHTFGAMVGYGWQNFYKKYNLSYDDPMGNELQSDTHYETEYFLLSFYGRVNYSYDDRYLITATLRGDASSRFASDNRWGIFP